LRVGTSSEKAQKTRSDPNFWITAISETHKNKNRKKTQIFTIFSQKIAKIAKNRKNRDFCELGNVWKLPKYFRNLKNGNFRNLQKQNFWKKPSNAGP